MDEKVNEGEKRGKDDRDITAKDKEHVKKAKTADKKDDWFGPNGKPTKLPKEN